MLGVNGALFLAKFLATLALRYNQLCAQASQNSSALRAPLETQVCKIALEQVLKELSLEDLRSHGRLLTLKSAIVRQIFPNDKLDIKTLAFFQLKDFCGADKLQEQRLAQHTEAFSVTSADAITAMDYRQRNMVFPSAKLYEEGGDTIDNEIDKMREAILGQPGIVGDNNEEDFKYFVKNCMNRRMLDQIGGDVSTFQNQSFRLNALNRSSRGLAEQLKGFEVEKEDVAKMHKSMNDGPMMLNQSGRAEQRLINEVASSSVEGLDRIDASKDKPLSSDPYNTNLLNSKLQAQLVSDYKGAAELNSVQYLSDNELHFLQKLANNEALLEYFHYLQEGLVSLFIRAKISDGTYKIDGETPAVVALSLAGDIIPEVGNIFKGIGALIEWKNEKEIQGRLKKISQLVRDDQKNLVSEYISSKLLVKRRTYLANLTRSDIEAAVTNVEKLTLLFDDSNVYKVRAQIDLKILEALILSEDARDIQDVYVLPNFAEIFADRIVRAFMGNVKLKEMDPPLKERQEPEVQMMEKKFMLVEEYFTHERYALPLMIKKISGESEFDHLERVKRFLMACDDQRFTDIAFLINPENQFQQGFYKLYTEVTAVRGSQGRSPDSSNKRCCVQ